LIPRGEPGRLVAKWNKGFVMTSPYTKYPGLADRVVYVTGGGSGVGAEVVRGFVANGSRVVFCDVDESSSSALVNELRGKQSPRFEKLDLRDIGALERNIAQVVQEEGPIRVLVNNAARDDRHEFGKVTGEFFDENMAVNYRHQFFAAQAARPGMAKAGGGSIINMSSITATMGHEGLPVYASAKAAIIGLTRSLARILGPENIRVNAILPGWVMTERQVTKWLTPEAAAQLMKDQCLKREIAPRDVANLVLFLASDDSAMITRQTVVVDAGWT
jgi:NAD(P)-dependent dehydrogenase (short-subunit alcohol dehydrogenase family)